MLTLGPDGKAANPESEDEDPQIAKLLRKPASSGKGAVCMSEQCDHGAWGSNRSLPYSVGSKHVSRKQRRKQKKGATGSDDDDEPEADADTVHEQAAAVSTDGGTGGAGAQGSTAGPKQVPVPRGKRGKLKVRVL